MKSTVVRDNTKTSTFQKLSEVIQGKSRNRLVTKVCSISASVRRKQMVAPNNRIKRVVRLGSQRKRRV